MKNNRSEGTYFNKCIDLSKELLACCDNNCIYILSKNKKKRKNCNSYLIVKVIITIKNQRFYY